MAAWEQQQAQWGGAPAPFGAPAQPQHQGGDMAFMSFDLSGAAAAGGGGAGGAHAQPGGAGGGFSGGGGFGGSMGGGGGNGMTSGRMGRVQSYASFDDEPPLLEELGINLPIIWKKTTHILLPTSRVNSMMMEDGDLCGPIAFLLALGSLLLLTGKVYFGVIYGWSVVGSMAVYTTLNLLAGKGDSVDFYTCTSLVGYCMLPLLAPAALALVMPRGMALNAIALAASLWGASVGSRYFCAMVKPFHGQRVLVAVPLMLLYSAFSTLIVF